MPLTDTAIRNAKPREKAYKLFDGDGLFLLISPAGSKAWRLKYRLDGKEKLLVLPDVAQNRNMRQLCANPVAHNNRPSTTGQL